ncbi:MAG: LysR family transcriptional regulator [Elusimicrobia bacterium]|nr:LysR family transcriptional regulator [Elusimicrobiota bacterium]
MTASSHLTLRELQYLVAVAEHRHFGKAAQACAVTQPTLSMQISKLEKRLGLVLFERTNKKVLLAAGAQPLIDRARAVLKDAEALEALALSAKDPQAGELRVGVFPTLGPYFLPFVVRPVVQRFKRLRLIFSEEKTAVLIRRLREGDLDAAFIALPVKEDCLETRPLFEEEFLLALPENLSRGWGRRARPEQLRGQRLLLLEEGHCLRDQALQFCSKTGSSELPDFRASSLETLRQMVAAGVGMTLIPRLAVRKDPGIRYLPFDEPRPSRRIGLACRKSFWRKKLLEELGNTVIKSLPGPAYEG